MNASSVTQSALSMVQMSNSRALDAVRVMASNPDHLVDGMMQLAMAKLGVQAGAKVLQAVGEMDDAMLDILA